MKGQSDTITAQGRADLNQNTGISIHNSTITETDDLDASNYPVATYLGRPWKEYARAVYIQSFLDGLIVLSGWLEWNGTFALNMSYLGEFDNKGSGSVTADRVKWLGHHVLNETDAAKFTVSSFFRGQAWLTPTRVPY